MKSSVFMVVIVALLSACSNERDCATPNHVSPGTACCADTVACTRGPENYYGTGIVELSLEALCGGDACPSTLASALASERCVSAAERCGVVELTLVPNGELLVSPRYDIATGNVVAAWGESRESYVTSFAGCCGIAFRAGTFDTTCTEPLVPIACGGDAADAGN